MQDYPLIVHHGGKEGVTGSCHELRVSPEAGILVDCGLFQGEEANIRDAGRGMRDADPITGSSHPASRDPRPGSPFDIDFPTEHLKALVVTHAHIDHAGRIPWLLAAGFSGPIYCSEPTAVILPLMLEDAFRVGISRDARLAEKYLAELARLIVPIPYGRWHDIPAGHDVELKIRLQPAGHILGSAYVECRVCENPGRGPRNAEGEKHMLSGPPDFRVPRPANRLPVTKILFSGDLGAPYAPLLPAPRSPWGADVLVLESTYGDRLHEGRKDRRERLRQVIEHALVDRGAILVPAFALGRTQELLYELEGIIHSNRSRFAAMGLGWEDLEVILDSPLARRITDAYRQLRPFWDAEALRRVRNGRRPLAFEQLTVIESHTDHENSVRHLQRHGRPCIVLAGSGMCNGGRIVNYLKALLGDPRTDILFLGYQASGTPGRAIQEYGPRGGYVFLDGQRYDIRARVHTIGGYSAHADQKNLVDFVRRMRKKPAEIHLVHGDAAAQRALAEILAVG